MIKLSCVIGVLNGFELADRTIQMMYDNLGNKDEVEIIVIDNGSDEAYLYKTKLKANIGIIRNENNTGNYPMFKQGIELAHGEVIAFIHSDVFIFEKGWDQKVIAQFEANEKLGLVGFLGSTELDYHGGRGGGTVSNMVKYEDYGSEAEIHGRRDTGFIIDGSVVDGLAMIFRKSVLKEIGFKDDYPRHHFYDRMMSCQVIEAGYKVGIMGIEHCHCSGKTANHEQKWQDTAKEWCKVNLGINSPQEWPPLHPEWFNSLSNASHGHIPNGWDHVIYLEAEYRFLKEYRDEKHVVPLYFGRRV